MSSSFADLGLSEDAVRALKARGITDAFPIQVLAIPPALEGKDICGRAPTGSGKTLAFGLPVAARVSNAKPKRPHALILAPTRELAGQIQSEMSLLVDPDRRHKVASFYGGVSFGNQLKALRAGVDVAVACPGRLRDLIEQNALSLRDCSIVVVDEADRMADMGFMPDVKWILDQVRPDRQTLLFSATLDGDVNQLIKHYQKDPVRVAVEVEEDNSRTSYHWLDVLREDRVNLTAHLVASHGPTIVFCRTKHGTDRIAKQLSSVGIRAAALHGGRSQAQREQALRAFSTGRVDALVATDVAARGIHVDGVNCVVHFDMPGSAKDYLHRSGRTGRAGADGVVVSMVTSADRGPVRGLQKAIGQPVTKNFDSPSLLGIDLRTAFAPSKPRSAGEYVQEAAPSGDRRPPRPQGQGQPSQRRRRPAGASQGRSSGASQGRPSGSSQGRPGGASRGRPASGGSSRTSRPPRRRSRAA
ncbi:MAG TPA: DEAD/DEAH box helicase [Acidimicrobiales bacterium]